MPKARVWHVTGFQGQPLTLPSRVRFNGDLITQAAISGITMLAKRLAQGVTEETLTQTALTVANVVFDTLQLGSRWTTDDTGYNFLPTVPASAFPDPDEYYIVFAFTPASGSPFIEIVRATIIGNLGAI